MKIDTFETHDRLQHFIGNQSLNIAQGASDCLTKNSLSLAIQDKSHYVYIFAHPRTADDGITKRMLWQPRLTKPRAQTNSYLFRAKSKTDILEVCWLIPPVEMWGQYKKGNVTEHELVNWSIDQFLNHRKQLEEPDPDDWSDRITRNIYRNIAMEFAGKQELLVATALS